MPIFIILKSIKKSVKDISAHLEDSANY